MNGMESCKFHAFLEAVIVAQCWVFEVASRRVGVLDEFDSFGDSGLLVDQDLAPPQDLTDRVDFRVKVVVLPAVNAVDVTQELAYIVVASLHFLRAVVLRADADEEFCESAMVQESDGKGSVVKLPQFSVFELVDEASNICIAVLVDEFLHKVGRQQLMLVNFLHQLQQAASCQVFLFRTCGNFLGSQIWIIRNDYSSVRQKTTWSKRSWSASVWFLYNHQWNLDLECELSQLFFGLYFFINHLSCGLLLCLDLHLFLQSKLGLYRRIAVDPYLDPSLHWMLERSVTSCCLLWWTFPCELTRSFRSLGGFAYAVSCETCACSRTRTNCRRFGAFLFGTRVFFVLLF